MHWQTAAYHSARWHAYPSVDLHLVNQCPQQFLFYCGHHSSRQPKRVRSRLAGAHSFVTQTPGHQAKLSDPNWVKNSTQQSQGQRVDSSQAKLVAFCISFRTQINLMNPLQEDYRNGRASISSASLLLPERQIVDCRG